MKNILVTGNKGYIGSVLTDLLLQKKYNVIGLDTDFYKGCEFWIPAYAGMTLGGIKQITKDIRQVTTKDLQDIDAVIHLAALSNDPLCDFNEEITYDINYRAAVKLAKLAKQQGVQRFVFSSSQSMYGIAKGSDWVYEDSLLNPLTAYGKSKIMAEQEITKLADETFTPVFLRPSTVYGISPKLRVDIVLNNLVGWAATTEKIKILSNGMPWRPVIHVEDISRAFIAALLAPKNLVHDQVFNVGEKESYRIKDMADLIQKIIPGCEIEYAHERGNDERSYRINSDKFRKVLKKYYRQKWNIQKGIKALYDAYKSHGLTREEFTGNKYIRLNQLKKLVAAKKLDEKFFWKR